MTAPRRIRLHEPQLGKHEVVFGWDVTPRSSLYCRTNFRLEFAPQVAAERVPDALWLRLMMLCLYPHWALMAPCRVDLPARLEPGERDFWLRLIEAAAVNLEQYGRDASGDRTVELVECGPPLPPTVLSDGNQRVTAAYSGGKDSLVQTALLAELTEQPLLVTTTSPVRWANDHRGAARQRALDGITQRRGLDVVEIRSDFRSCWDNNHPLLSGCTIRVNELCDVLLYQATALAVAAANRISRAFLASEADLQTNVRRGGMVVQHSHFASSAVTQTAVSALMRPFGIALGSLLYPLHMHQVMALLWRRYPDLADLQFSCWQAENGEQACGRCGQCAQVAVAVLSEGHSPTAVGIDPLRLLRADATWQDTRRRGAQRAAERSGRNNYERWIRDTPTSAVKAILTADPLVPDDGVMRALAVYDRIRRREMRRPAPPPGGYIRGFLDFIDPDLRGGLESIFDEHLDAAPDEDFTAVVGRSRVLADWIAAPLEHDRQRAALAA
jgi:7-cyano-7-deazaguanine synthase in queuosine biosynthesis